MSAAQPASTDANRLLWLLGLASFTSMASMRACDALLPQLAGDFATTTGAAAQTIAAFAVAYGLLQLAYGPLGDRHGKLPIIAGATLACALANLAIAQAASLNATIAWRAVAGAAGGGIVPLSIATLGDSVAYGQRQETLARLSLATILGMTTGQWLGGLVADAWGWRAVFYGLAAGFTLAAWPLLVAARHATAPAKPALPQVNFLAQARQLLRVPWVRVVLATTALEGAFAFAPLAFVPSHLHHEFGLSLSQGGAVMALYGAGGLVFALGARPLIRGLGERGLVRLGGCAVALCMGLLAWGPSWHWAMLACLVGGVGLYMLHSTLQTHATQMWPQGRGTAVSLFVVSLFGAQSLGVAAAALVVDHATPRWVFAAGALVLPLLALGFSNALRRHQVANARDKPVELSS